MGVLAYLQFC